jgi:hypothetical protein
MGCLSRIGCLAVLAGAGAVGWWLYGGPLPEVAERIGLRPAAGVADRPMAWSSAATASARAGDAVARLGQSGGPGFVRLGAGELADFLSTGLQRVLPAPHGRVDVAIADDRVYLRTAADLRQLVGDRLGERLGDGTMGRVLGTLSGRDSLLIGGTIGMVRPGLAQYRVRTIRLGGFELPPRAIPWVVGALRQRAQLDSLAPDAVPLPLPRQVGDVRVAEGRVTLYRATP